MTNSDSRQPDLDWSQIRETVKLLTVSVALVQRSMQEGDSSVNVLTDSFTSMVEDMNVINSILNSLDPDEKRDLALQHCSATSEKIRSSIVAFQFYDRLQQSLHHVTNKLQGLSQLIDDPQRLYNPMEWKVFQDDIRGQYTMESEKLMFDAILQGKSMDEAISMVTKMEENTEEDIELF